MLLSLLMTLERVVFFLILAKVILSYFMDPFHPIRQTIDQLVEPMLAPIRRFIPPLGGIDFSPIVLMVLVEIVFSVLRSLLI